ncbi:MAG: hypothetical protein ACFE9T_05235, partial [Promethearchaeota archaeon]
MKNANYKYIILGLSLFLCLSNLISFTFLHNNLNGTRDQENNIPKLSTQEIIIISPEEKDYLAPMSGYYPATYSFTHEIPGTIGTDIDFVDIYYKSGLPPGYFDAYIYSEWYDHHEVLILQDAQSGYYLYVEHKNFNETNGAIEWFWGMNQPSQNSFFRLMKNDTVAFGIRISNFNFIYDGNTTSTVTSCSSNTWYHNSLSFDCNAAGNGQFTWVISRENGTEIARAENIGFSNNVASIDTIHL